MLQPCHQQNQTVAMHLNNAKPFNSTGDNNIVTRSRKAWSPQQDSIYVTCEYAGTSTTETSRLRGSAALNSIKA